jgi:uncharacterized protein (DUF486 family)
MACAIALILFGAANLFVGMYGYIESSDKKTRVEVPSSAAGRWGEWFFIMGLIFVGSVSYTIAAYYHLKLRNWSFLTAFAIAIPFILVEYQFSIRGNRAAKDVLRLNAVQITLVTMTFYFINSWILNKFFLKQKAVWWREILAFALIVCAFFLSSTTTA